MRLRACLVAFVSFACAPSVPRPMRQPPAADASGDVPTTTMTVAVDARPATVDAKPDAADARPDAVDTRPDIIDARADTKADTPRADSAPLPADAQNRDRPAGTDTGVDTGVDGDDDGGDTSDLGPSDGASDGLSAVVPTAGDVAIDELLINPAGTDTNREWIEIANVSSATLDLHQLHVADAASDVAVDAGLLAPGGLLVLGQSLDPTKNGGAPIAVSFGNVDLAEQRRRLDLDLPRPVRERGRAGPGRLDRGSGRCLRRARRDRRRDARPVLPRRPTFRRRRQLRQPRRAQSAVSP